jgi:peptidoglycan/xylan/chitin deacetylase (PgdA/CDA1 family)
MFDKHQWVGSQPQSVDLQLNGSLSCSVPITFFAVAKSFERNLDVPAYVEANGHETCSHGYRVSRQAQSASLPELTGLKWRSYSDMSPEEEEEHVRKAVASFKQTSPSGRVPNGWYASTHRNNDRAIAERPGSMVDPTLDRPTSWPKCTRSSDTSFSIGQTRTR